MTSAPHESAASTKANASKAAGVTAREAQRASASQLAVGVAGNMAVQRAFGALGLSAGDTIQRKCAAGGGCECAECSAEEELKAAGIQRMAIRPVDDPLEHEADRMADAVLSQPPGRPLAPTGMTASALQRKPSGPGAPPAAASATKAGLAGGRGLDDAVHGDLSARFGHDFTDVRVHDDPAAHKAADALNAAAFTSGEHIVFGAGRFAPDTTEGRRLLAHELAHVLQQRGGAVRGVQRQEQVTAPPSTTSFAVTGPYTSGDIQLAGGEHVQGIGTPSDPSMVRVQLSAPHVHAYEPFNIPRNLVRSLTDAASAPMATIDPSLINVQSITNSELIRYTQDAQRFLGAAVASTPESEAWQQLQRDLNEERTRRVARGYIFLAERTESLPLALYQMRSGAVAGTIEIVTTDVQQALGSPDTTLTGGIMSPSQIRAYIATLGYRTITGPQATQLLANRESLLATGTTGQGTGQWQPPALLPPPRGMGRNPYFDVMLANQGRGQLPLGLGGPNFRGRVAELGTGSDWRTGWGRGLSDYNLRPWIDSTGRTQTGNFPVLDFGPNQGLVPRILDIRPISVTSSGAPEYETRRQQYTMKIEALLDVAGRRATAPTGTDPVLEHLRLATGDATLAAGTTAHQQAQARYLPDTMFAVPDANVAQLRAEISNPNAAPAGGTQRMIARAGGLRDLYTAALRASPVTLTLRDGSSVTVNNLGELAARAPSASTFTVAGGPAPYPPTQRVSTAEFNRALGEVGRTAASRIVPIGSALAMAGAADRARAPAGGVTATPTRVLEINSADLSYVSARIGEGLADVRTPGAPGSGSTRWTTAAEGDAALAAVRALSGDQTLQRGTPEFDAARRQALGSGMLAINADDVQAFRGTVLAEGAWDGRLRASFGAAMADNPITVTAADGTTHTFQSPDALDAARATLSPDEYASARARAQGLVAGRVTGSGVTTEQLVRLEGFRDRAVTGLGDRATSVLTPDVLAHARLGSPRATAGAFGRGGTGGMVIGVLTTAGMMYIDEREHPDWAWELARTGGRDFAVTGSQSAIESRLTYYMAERAIESGVPLSGLARFGARAGVAAPFAAGMELYNISQTEREVSAVEGVSRVGRAVGIAIVSMEIGAAVGSIVPIAGTLVGAVVGLLVGAGVGLILENVVPGSGEDWDRAAAEEARRRQAAAPPRPEPPPPIATFGGTTTLEPVMSSPSISTEEQMAIARWATLLTMARRDPPAGAALPP